MTTDRQNLDRIYGDGNHELITNLTADFNVMFGGILYDQFLPVENKLATTQSMVFGLVRGIREANLGTSVDRPESNNRKQCFSFS
jgi:hypothetical protein